MRRPRFHLWTALFQQISATMGRSNLVRDGMRERTFSKVSLLPEFAGTNTRSRIQNRAPLRPVRPGGVALGFRAKPRE